MLAMLETSLVFLSPQICPSAVSPGLSTATKLARTLLTWRLFDVSEGVVERPRLGGEPD